MAEAMIRITLALRYVFIRGDPLTLQIDALEQANLDIQYTEGISFPTPNIYYSTGGSPPFIPDSETPTNTNEPYLDWLNFVLAQSSVPQTFTTSYGDDEQTVSVFLPNHHPQSFL